MIRTIKAISATLFILCLAACGNEPESYADLIIEGRIFTAESDSSFATAVAVKNGKIIALDEDALSERGDNTEFIKTDGLVVPGFIDCHSHGPAGLRLGQLAKTEKDSVVNGLNPFSRTAADDSMKCELILSYQKLMASNGITAYLDACTNFEDFDLVELYEKLDNEGKLFIHTFGSYKITSDRIAEIDSVSSLSTAYKGGNFEMNTIKIYLDKQTFLKEDDDAENVFITKDIIPARKISRIISSANTGNLSVAAHAYGADGIKTFAEYSSIKASDKSRNYLIHIQSVDDKCIEAIYAANVSAVVNPFCFSIDTTVMDSTILTVYKEFPDRIHPVKDLVDKNVHVAVGIDYPASRSLNFADAIYRLATRKRPNEPDSSALSASQAISVPRAIRCATAEGAYIIGRENSLGTITIGKAADLVILEKDIISCPLKEIPEVKVSCTIIGGRPVYRKSDSVR